MSVDTEAEAKALIVLACETNGRGQYIARELVQDQTLENLESFGQRLAKAHDDVFVKQGRCRCGPRTKKGKTMPKKKAVAKRQTYDCYAGEKCLSEDTDDGKEECTEDDFCSGCSAYLCDACAPEGPWGGHTPEEHLEHARKFLGLEDEDE
jgi:hypothetical protein